MLITNVFFINRRAKNLGKNAQKNIVKQTDVVLDTNAFYDFCHVLGLKDFGIETGINQRVDYIAYKVKIEDALRNKTLFIPATTVFEFVCRLRNKEECLKKVIGFLEEISQKYSYDLFAYNKYDNYGILFGFDQFSDEYWDRIHANYENLIELKEKIMLAKIGSEAEIMTMFSRSIIHLFFLDYFCEKPGYDVVIKSFNTYFFMNPFGDGLYRGIKKTIAWELFEHYKNNEEGLKKNKKAIFESTVKITAHFLKEFWDFMYESFLKKEKESIKSINVELSSEESIQTNIYKWFNVEKNKDNLTKNIEFIIASLRARCDFNDSQFTYWESAFINLFTHGSKREKNDAEDYWNLGFVKTNQTYLISFELEILDILKQQNKENYDFIREFYNYD